MVRLDVFWNAYSTQIELILPPQDAVGLNCVGLEAR
jgi:hypothetical protein